MTLYKQNPLVPFNGGVYVQQPGGNPSASYTFARGTGPALGNLNLLPNAQQLGPEWRLHNPGNQFPASQPCADVSRQEMVCEIWPAVPADLPSAGGMVARLPAAIVALEEFMIYSSVAVQFLLDTAAPADTDFIARAGLCLFQDEPPVLPGGDPGFYMAGIEAIVDESAAIHFNAHAEKWTAHDSPGTPAVISPIGGNAILVRWYIRQASQALAQWSIDGKHWVNVGGFFDLGGGDVNWIGCLVSSWKSVAIPEFGLGGQGFFGPITIYTITRDTGFLPNETAGGPQVID